MVTVRRTPACQQDPGQGQTKYYLLQVRYDFEEWYRRCNTCAASRGPQTRSLGLMHQYNVGTSFERITIDVAGPFLHSDQGNRYLLIAVNYFSKWLEAYAISN
jgi:hypothetical protein